MPYQQSTGSCLSMHLCSLLILAAVACADDPDGHEPVPPAASYHAPAVVYYHPSPLSYYPASVPNYAPPGSYVAPSGSYTPRQVSPKPEKSVDPVPAYPNSEVSEIITEFQYPKQAQEGDLEDEDDVLGVDKDRRTGRVYVEPKVEPSCSGRILERVYADQAYVSSDNYMTECQGGREHRFSNCNAHGHDYPWVAVQLGSAVRVKLVVLVFRGYTEDVDVRVADSLPEHLGTRTRSELGRRLQRRNYHWSDLEIAHFTRTEGGRARADGRTGSVIFVQSKGTFLKLHDVLVFAEKDNAEY